MVVRVLGLEEGDRRRGSVVSVGIDNLEGLLPIPSSLSS